MKQQIRSARDEDSSALISLIADCFAAYPGCLLDVDREAPHLRAIASAYRAWNGKFWIAQRGEVAAGSVGVLPARVPGGMELRALYVDRRFRRRGIARRLVGRVEEEARRRGAGFVELWSDTRFVEAHLFYARLGYDRSGARRELGDLSHTRELYFRKDLVPLARS